MSAEEMGSAAFKLLSVLPAYTTDVSTGLRILRVAMQFLGGGLTETAVNPYTEATYRREKETSPP